MKRRLLSWPTIEARPPGAPLPSLWIRLAWVAGIWAVSVGVLLSVAMLLRLALKV